MSRAEYWNPLVPELTVTDVSTSLGFYTIEVPMVFAVAERLKQAGYPLYREPKERWYAVSESREEGQIELLAQDPDGYLMRFVQVLRSRQAPLNPSSQPTTSDSG